MPFISFYMHFFPILLYSKPTLLLLKCLVLSGPRHCYVVMFTLKYGHICSVGEGSFLSLFFKDEKTFVPRDTVAKH